MKRTDCSGHAVSPSLRAQLVSVHVTYTCESLGPFLPPGPPPRMRACPEHSVWALSWPAKPPRGGHAWLVHTCKSWGLSCPPGPCIRGHAWLFHGVLGPFLARSAPASNAGMLGTWRLGPLSGPLGPRFAGMLGACVMVFMIFYILCIHRSARGVAVRAYGEILGPSRAILGLCLLFRREECVYG